jgi:excisionase family DNA binding protein
MAKLLLRIVSLQRYTRPIQSCGVLEVDGLTRWLSEALKRLPRPFISETSSYDRHPTMNDPVRPIAITIEEASKLSGIPRSSIYVLLRKNLLQGTKVGRRHLILYDGLERLVKGESLEAA